MKLLLPFLLVAQFLSAQLPFQCDTVIKTEAYTSYYSYRYKTPVEVVYKLWKGCLKNGCKRTSFSFKNDIKGLKTARQKDYDRSGYDEGHMANAQDFAGDCRLDEMTFRFYNCVPQTPALNRGPWKQWEGEIRHESQDDSLLITCGNIFSDETIGPDSVYVPALCWKKVERLRDGSVLHVIICSNNNAPECKEQNIEILENLFK